MQAIYVFAAATCLITLVAIAVCILLRKSLAALLGELCEGQVRSPFWTLFAQTCVVLATLFSAIVFAPRKELVADAPMELFGVFVGAARGGLFGLLGVLAFLGLVLVLSIVSFNAKQRRDPRAPSAT